MKMFQKSKASKKRSKKKEQSNNGEIKTLKDKTEAIILKTNEIMALSSRYYELIPKEKFKNRCILPFDRLDDVKNEIQIIDNLTYVEKAVNMAKLMNVPILGLVENMAYFKCDQCGKEHYIFGESKAKEAAEKYNIPVYAALPISPDIASVADKGLMELYEGEWLAPIVNEIEK